MRPTLSVIIPTRNGERYLQPLLELCHISNSVDVEFLVIDNSDSPIQLSLPADDRIKIVRDGKLRSMTDNWDHGAKLASGKWKTFLGDDDGILPEEFDIFVENLRASDADVVVANFSHFFWPGAQDFVKSLTLQSGVITSWVGGLPSAGLRALTGNPEDDFEHPHYPIPYARAAFNEEIEDVIRQLNGGQLFCATSPDINLGAALQLSARKVVVDTAAAFIVGTSPKSNGLAHFRKPKSELAKDFKNLNSHSWLPELGDSQPPLSYLSYLEPIAQAKKAKFGTPDLPKPVTIISKSLQNQGNSAEIRKILLRLYPNLAFTVRALSIVFGILAPFTTRCKFAIYLFRRLVFGRARFERVSSPMISDTLVAAKLLATVRFRNEGFANELNKLRASRFSLDLFCGGKFQHLEK
jgi:glycosyltransferase involved in cell wall biosynthesis